MTSLILLRSFQESQIEYWKPIEGFKGYDVSSFGRVRSWWTRSTSPHPNGGTGCWYTMGNKVTILKFGTHRQGYLMTYLYKHNGKRAQAFVHRLVAKAFIGNSENKPEVNHLCGLKSDNRKDGLVWATRGENQRHAWDNGLITVEKVVGGQKNYASTITPDQALEIRQRRAQGESCESLRKEFGVSNGCISEIVTGKTFKNVKGPLTRKQETWRLLPDDVRTIRRMVETKAASQTAIARQFKIDPSDVSRIAARKRYAYVA
jgi:hypothetical protein